MPEALDLLATRRSVPALALDAPAPEGEALRRLLGLAARVPDHGKLAPWRFVVFEGAAREAVSARLGGLFAEIEPDAPDEKKKAAATLFTRAPLVVLVVSQAREHPKIPEWEQVLSAGAVCLALCQGAHAMGFAANWLSGWAAYEPRAHAIFGLEEGERVAGFVHVGTPATRPADRDRPDIDAITTFWKE